MVCDLKKLRNHRAKMRPAGDFHWVVILDPARLGPALGIRRGKKPETSRLRHRLAWDTGG